ncbi:MAG: CHASE3 domain sensor protein, partial [Phenylobacterium sp.]
MTIKLKIKHKIYGGFATIVALLVISSLSAVSDLNAISRSTIEVNDLAVPVERQSNQLQISLLKQAKLSTLSFNHTSSEEVDLSMAKFTEDTEQFTLNYRQLALLVEQEPTLKNNLNQAQASYQRYTLAVGNMLKALKARIELTLRLNQSHGNLLRHIDEASAVLLELSYLEGDYDP